MVDFKKKYEKYKKKFYILKGGAEETQEYINVHQRITLKFGSEVASFFEEARRGGIIFYVKTIDDKDNTVMSPIGSILIHKNDIRSKGVIYDDYKIFLLGTDITFTNGKTLHIKYFSKKKECTFDLDVYINQENEEYLKKISISYGVNWMVDNSEM